MPDTKSAGERLVLIRLLVAPKRRETIERVVRDVGPLLPNGAGDVFGKEAQEEAIQKSIAALADRMLVHEEENGKVAMTPEGASVACRALGLKREPGRLSWKALQNGLLVAVALGLPLPTAAQRRRLSSAEGLRAAVVAKRQRLAVGPYPTLTQVRNALLWRELGRETDRPFTIGAVGRYLLNRMMGHETEQPVKQLLRELAGRLVGGGAPDTGVMRQELIRNWLAALEAKGPRLGDKPEAAPATCEPTREDGESGLHVFAARVLELASTSPGGRFGGDKVFISRLWRAYEQGCSGAGIDRQWFDDQLRECHMEGLLSLCRADLVEAMDPADVAESEIRHLTATFHFLKVPE